MFASFGAIAGATGTALVAQHEARAEALSRQREREIEEWENEHLIPLMTAEHAAAFRAERQRLKERREDVKRQERQHRERMEVERRKAAALEMQANRSRCGFGLGLLLGTVIDGD